MKYLKTLSLAALAMMAVACGEKSAEKEVAQLQTDPSDRDIHCYCGERREEQHRS